MKRSAPASKASAAAGASIRSGEGFVGSLLTYAAVLAGALAVATPAAAQPAVSKPTIVPVHRVFAEFSTWDGGIANLVRDGYQVVAVANPLRSDAGDAAYVAAVACSVQSPIVFVGHPFGGTVISVAASDAPNVKGLVYVDALARALRETSLDLTCRFLGGMLGYAVAVPVSLPGGGEDRYSRQARFRAQFAGEATCEVDPPGNRAIVTGGSSRIGVATARARTSPGALVTARARQIAAGQRNATEIVAGAGTGQVPVALLNLAEQASVTARADASSGPLHMLVNNARIIAQPLQRAPEGWEMLFPSSHVDNFPLANGQHGEVEEARLEDFGVSPVQCRRRDCDLYQ